MTTSKPLRLFRSAAARAAFDALDWEAEGRAARDKFNAIHTRRLATATASIAAA